MLFRRGRRACAQDALARKLQSSGEEPRKSRCAQLHIACGRPHGSFDRKTCESFPRSRGSVLGLDREGSGLLQQPWETILCGQFSCLQHGSLKISKTNPCVDYMFNAAGVCQYHCAAANDPESRQHTLLQTLRALPGGFGLRSLRLSSPLHRLSGHAIFRGLSHLLAQGRTWTAPGSSCRF